MPSSPDWAEERDASDSAATGISRFGLHADSLCVFCYSIARRKTAEVLYMAPEWDYYYCYRCRGWFKRHYKDRNVFLPVRARSDIRFLTWHYTSQMQAMYDIKKVGDGMRTAWHFVERHFRVPDQPSGLEP